ncbi:MAG TPA: type II toxin-antitoxin system RelE/ParE family toxin, partial [Allosphingosinicella sp.]|nr:type II toxin-antitoxin system RelE/ParE family toxin [Allosphingosinicella sp.]
MEACAERLPDHPFLYRPGRAPGTREAVVHPNYILIYRVKGEAVEIALSSTRGSAIRDPSAERALAGRHGVVQAIGGG